MNLLNQLKEQARTLWLKASNCQNLKEKELLLKEYYKVYQRYIEHRNWLRILES